MGESRQELLAWVNGLLDLNLTRVEQCGTGAPVCQIYDSIYRDLPMNRVKFNVNAEYAYIENWKILASAFTRWGIDRTINIQSLVRCKMQDNLDFLQFTKRHWDQYYPGDDYDPVARRGRNAVAPAPTARAPPATARTSTARRPGGASIGGPGARTTPLGGATNGAAGAVTAQLRTENAELKDTVIGLEKERDFYFSKLRDIELLIQEASTENPEIIADGSLPKTIQDILYSTEEGFEIPAETEAEAGEAVGDGHEDEHPQQLAEEETF